MAIENRVNTASENDVYQHLCICDASFTPQLSTRVNLAEYSKKIVNNAETIETWCDDNLIGLLAVYFNNASGYITNVSVVPEFTGKGIGTELMTKCISIAGSQGITKLELEVDGNDDKAQRFYSHFEFALSKKGERLFMSRVYPQNKK